MTAVVDQALAHGTTLFDSSPMYGRSEATLGRALDASAAFDGGRADLMQIHNMVGWRTRLDQVEALAPSGITTWGQALLAWGLAHPAVTTSIPATSKPERAGENAAAGVLPPLDPDTRDRITAAFTR